MAATLHFLYICGRNLLVESNTAAYVNKLNQFCRAAGRPGFLPYEIFDLCPKYFTICDKMDFSYMINEYTQ